MCGGGNIERENRALGVVVSKRGEKRLLHFDQFAMGHTVRVEQFSMPLLLAVKSRHTAVNPCDHLQPGFCAQRLRS